MIINKSRIKNNEQELFLPALKTYSNYFKSFGLKFWELFVPLVKVLKSGPT